MEDSAKAPFIDQLLGESNGRDTAIVVPDHVWHAGPFHGFHHLQSLGPVHGERLFAQDHLARFRCGNRDLLVHVIGARDIDQIDVFSRQQLAPVSFMRLITPFAGESFYLGFLATADGLQNRLVFEVEEIANLAESVRVRAAHEAVADESDVERFHGDLWLVSIRSVSADAVLSLSSSGSSGGEGWGEEAVS